MSKKKRSKKHVHRNEVGDMWHKLLKEVKTKQKKRTKEEDKVLSLWHGLDKQYRELVLMMMKKLGELPAVRTIHCGNTSNYSMRTDDSGPGPYQGDPGYIPGPGGM